MFTWTEEQSSAIGLRECNILVSAAAGSGKTAVLVERIKSLIADELTPARPDRMLVVTFTEAAAAEMRRKIIDAVSSESEKSDSEFPIEQLQRVFTASVGTFHSFALGILKRYYYIIDMEPAFNICDEFRKTLLVNEALDALFEEYFERDGGDSDFLDFLNKYAGAKNENAVREMIADSHAFIQSLPDPFAWLESRTEALSRSTEDFQVGDVFLGLLDEIASDLEAAAIRIERLGDYLEAEGVPSLARKNEADLAQLLDLVQSAKTTLAGARANAERSRRRGAEGVSLCADVGFDALGARIKNFAFARFDCAKSDKDCYEPIREIVNKRRKRAKDRLKKLADKFFSNPLAEMTEEIRYTCAPARKLCEAVRRFDELFSAIKRREGVIDFNDIEHMALRILEDERVCAEYRDKFDHIFIDEYQDNNLIQEELISRIKREDNLFMVGDVKQSIYKFRLAEPEIFIGKYNNEFTDEEGAPNRRIDLNRNFRSKGGILDNVNAVFSRLMDSRLSGIAYDEKAALRKGLVCDVSWDRPVELRLVDMSGGAENGEADPAIADLREAEAEALAAAKIIRETVEGGATFFDAKIGEERSFRYSDIVILLREVSNTGAIWCDTLMSENVPAFADSGEGYFDSVEIETFMNLLRVIDNLRQDTALAGTIYSPVFGFTSEDLIRIRLERRDGPFYAAFLACARTAGDDTLDDERIAKRNISADILADADLRRRCASALARIEAWRHDEMFMDLPDFLWKLMKESGYYDYAGALPGGAQRRANLRALTDRAEAFQTNRIRGLFGFIGYIDAIRSKKISVGQVKLLSEGDDTVRIMSIHKSKGLEFPMVVVGQMAGRLGGRGSGGRLGLHKDIGIALQWEDYKTHTYRKTLLQKTVAYRREREERAEAVRVFYVAMTRAMDRLVLLGAAKNAAALLADADMADPVADTDVMSARSYLDMILPILSESGTDASVIALSELGRADEARSCSEEASAGMLATLDGACAGDFRDEVERRLTYEYPFAGALSVKSKYSVSELNRETSVARYFIEGSAEESLEDEGALNAAERGIALHKAFEKLDYAEAFARRRDPGYFKNFLDDLVQRRFLTAEQRDAASEEALRRYAETEIFARAAASRNLRKETPFNLKWERYGEPVIVQGVIDCFFEEDGKIVVIDFKSGRFDPARAGEESRLAARYGAQINIYREALESVLDVPADEAYLYLVNVGKTIAIQRVETRSKA